MQTSLPYSEAIVFSISSGISDATSLEHLKLVQYVNEQDTVIIVMRWILKCFEGVTDLTSVLDLEQQRLVVGCSVRTSRSF
ncbi:hypothetical protein BM1_00040 [Bipolaris maydis]|nr:hypothetical protein BM1_00040 [Bipolaris maydis]